MFRRSASAKPQNSRMPDLYVSHQEGYGGCISRFFVPQPDVDLVQLWPLAEKVVKERFDVSRFDVMRVSLYTAYLAIQWRWTPAVETRAQVDVGLSDTEKLFVGLYGELLSLPDSPIVERISLRSVPGIAIERGVGHLWLLGGS